MHCSLASCSCWDDTIRIGSKGASGCFSRFTVWTCVCGQTAPRGNERWTVGRNGCLWELQEDAKNDGMARSKPTTVTNVTIRPWCVFYPKNGGVCRRAILSLQNSFSLLLDRRVHQLCSMGWRTYRANVAFFTAGPGSSRRGNPSRPSACGGRRRWPRRTCRTWARAPSSTGRRTRGAS